MCIPGLSAPYSATVKNLFRFYVLLSATIRHFYCFESAKNKTRPAGGGGLRIFCPFRTA